MPNYNDFNLDIQKSNSKVISPEIKSCWYCPSLNIECVDSIEAKKN